MAKVTSAAIDAYLEELWEEKGTDLHITAGSPPMFRIDGALRKLPVEPLTPADTEALVKAILPKAMFDTFVENKEVDFSFSWQGRARFRGNAYHQREAMCLALRLIPFAIPTFEDLGLPEIAEDFANLPQGFVLVTGPTGGGKSTTLASIIDYINTTRACHIVTIEDPIEYVHDHKLAAVNQREVGVDTLSFARALRSALREDPDVLLVGEMRDLESIQLALTVAETGHLVFATLHTNDTAQSLDRIVDVFPGESQSQIRVQLANSLAGIMYQRLLPRLGGGLVAAFEVLVATGAVRNLIREGKTQQLRNIVATSQREGMQTMETALSELAAAGLITYDEAVAHSLYPKEIAKPAPVVPSEPASGPEVVEAGAAPGRRFRRSS